MKKLFLATITAISLSSGLAFAGSFNDAPVSVVPDTSSVSILGPNASFVGTAEYAFEADVFELNFGTEIYADRFTFTPYLTATHDSVNDTEFVGAAILVEYEVNYNVNLYTEVSFDEDWDYSESTIGVGFRF